jgi:hypothetical protein
MIHNRVTVVPVLIQAVIFLGYFCTEYGLQKLQDFPDTLIIPQPFQLNANNTATYLRDKILEIFFEAYFTFQHKMLVCLTLQIYPYSLQLPK